MIFKVNNQKESIECQKMLFEMGYIWYSGENNIQYYPITYLICNKITKEIKYNTNDTGYDNIIYFSMYIREKKLKRILYDKI